MLVISEDMLTISGSNFLTLLGEESVKIMDLLSIVEDLEISKWLILRELPLTCSEAIKQLSVLSSMYLKTFKLRNTFNRIATLWQNTIGIYSAVQCLLGKFIQLESTVS